MTTDELRAKFEAFHGMSWDDIRALPVSGGTKLHLQNAYKHDFEVWQAAHASRDAEVEALRTKVEWMREYEKSLNHRAAVEQVLLDCANGKREPITPEECRKLALKLGVPVKC